MKRNKIGLYARVSSLDDKQDYQRQIEDLKSVIKNHGYKDSQIEVFAEKVSGYKGKDDRPELNRMLKSVTDHPKDWVIYTTEVTRIGRKPIDTRRIIDNLTELGVPMYISTLGQFTLEKDGSRSMMINIILQVLIEYANLEAETFKQRSKSGLLHSAKQGKAGGSTNLPYGYKKDEKGYLVIDDEEAKIIKLIFQLYKSGHGIKVISNILNDKNVPTRTNKTHSGKIVKFGIEKDGSLVRWSDKTIHDIIRNTLYKGERKFKGHTIEAPAIIDKRLFDECAALLKSKTHRHYLTTYTYLLKDRCQCGMCGKSFMAKYKPIPSGDKVYICTSRLKKGQSCGNKGVNINLIESSIFSLLSSTPKIVNYVTDTNKLKIELEDSIAVNEVQITLKSSAIKSKAKDKERLLDLYLSGGMPKDMYMKKADEIEKFVERSTNEIDKLREDNISRKKALNNISNPKVTFNNFKNRSNNRVELEAIFKQFVHNVIINVIDDRTALIAIYISIKGENLKRPIKMLLDLKGVKKPKGIPKLYRFKALYNMTNEPVYNSKGILTGIADTELGGIEDYGMENLLQEFDKEKWQEVDKVLKVMPTD